MKDDYQHTQKRMDVAEETDTTKQTIEDLQGRLSLLEKKRNENDDRKEQLNNLREREKNLETECSGMILPYI